jgi:predicted ATPase
MRIRRLKLENWRNFRRVDVSLPHRVFLAGPNATGKTNFLDAFRFLRDISAAGFLKAVEARGGVSRIRCFSARHPADVQIDVNLNTDETSGSSGDWRYQLTFSLDKSEEPVIMSEKVWQGTDLLLERPTSDDARDRVRLVQTALEQTAANEKFRIVSTLFKEIACADPATFLIRNPQYDAGTLTDKDITGTSFIRDVVQAPERSRIYRLHSIQTALKDIVPHLHELDVVEDDRGQHHMIGRYKHWRLHDAQLSASHFSDGTLRLITLMWYLQDGENPLLLEEPERALHPGLTRKLAPLLQRLQKRRGKDPRQVIMTTHSPALLSDTRILPEEILLFVPGQETTEITPAATLRDARDLLESEWVASYEARPDQEDEADQMDMPFA